MELFSNGLVVGGWIELPDYIAPRNGLEKT